MITVFGSINVDMVMRVDALPAPGETVLCPEYLILPGGKGANQATAAARAGADVRMVGTVGSDAFAEAALELLRDGGVDLPFVRDGDVGELFPRRGRMGRQGVGAVRQHPGTADEKTETARAVRQPRIGLVAGLGCRAIVHCLKLFANGHDVFP